MRFVPRARAVIIAVALALHCVAACPIEPVDHALMSRPANQRQLRAIAARATAIGLAHTTTEVEAHVLAISAAWCTFSDFALTPVRPFHQVTATHQRWGLFTTASPERFRMYVEVHRPNTPWQIVYRPQDPHSDELAGMLEYRRVRGVWNPGSHGIRAPYPGFVSFVARGLFRRHPDVDLVRVRMEKLSFLHPGEREPRTAPLFEHEQVRRRRDVGLPE